MMALIFIIAVVALMVVVLAFSTGQRRVDRARLGGLYPANPATATREDILRLAEAGQKILAIKLYRQIHNTGLKEAKDAVEALVRSRNSSSPSL